MSETLNAANNTYEVWKNSERTWKTPKCYSQSAKYALRPRFSIKFLFFVAKFTFVIFFFEKIKVVGMYMRGPAGAPEDPFAKDEVGKKTIFCKIFVKKRLENTFSAKISSKIDSKCFFNTKILLINYFSNNFVIIN